MNDPSPPDLTAASEALAQRRVSAVELLAGCLEQIDRGNAAIRALTHVARDGAQADAEAADRRRVRGAPLGPLDGIPLVIKANIPVRGWPLTAGLRFRAQTLAESDAFVVSRLRAAGAVIVGLSNMDEGALGAEGNNPWFGAIQNPHRPGYSAGGSSGGSAAALAAGMCHGALGTDTIGSVRIPASFCGVAALKPSFGLVSVAEVVAVHLRFDHVGPMARSVRDLLPLLQATAAYDPYCRVSAPLSLTPPRGLDATRRIAFLSGLEQFQVADEVLAGYNDSIARIRATGVSLVHIDANQWDIGRLRRAILALCEREMWRVHRERISQQPEQYSDGLRAFIRYGGKLGEEELAAAETRIARFYAQWSAAMAAFDAVILPTTACTAFAHGERPPHNTADLTTLASATGLPALSLPVRVPEGALPVGLQIIGRVAGDLDLIQIGAELEAAK